MLQSAFYSLQFNQVKFQWAWSLKKDHFKINGSIDDEHKYNIFLIATTQPTKQNKTTWLVWFYYQ